MQEGGDLPEAFAVLGFAFYVQPMLMPLLHELPPGPASVSLTATAVRIVVIGVASLVRLPLLSHTKVSPSQQCKCARAYQPSHSGEDLPLILLHTAAFLLCSCGERSAHYTIPLPPMLWYYWVVILGALWESDLSALSRT